MTLTTVLKNLFLVGLVIILIPHVVGVFRGLGETYSRDANPRIVSMHIEGPITDSGCYLELLSSHFKDAEIKAILLKMNSIGGALGSGEALFNEIRLLKQEYKKPVVVLVENICTSVAYLVACAADYIVASPSALIGGIDVRMPWLQMKELLAQCIQSNAAQQQPEAVAEERAALQDVTDDAYKQFVQTVAERRRLSPGAQSEWANGKLFTGNQARRIGLIDAVGSYRTALAVIKQKALIEGEVELVQEACGSFWQRLFGGDLKGCSYACSKFFSSLHSVFVGTGLC